MLRVRRSLNATISGKTDQVSCAFDAYRIRCVWGKTAFSCIHELCESFKKHVYGYELSGLALVANVRIL